MNIQDYASKIKALYRKDRIQQDHSKSKLFLSLLIILIALASFGLGRLSGQGSIVTPIRIINPSVELGASAYTSKDDGKKLKITEPVLVGSISQNFYTFIWCSKAESITKEDLRYFFSIQEASKAGFLPDLSCSGLK